MELMILLVVWYIGVVFIVRALFEVFYKWAMNDNKEETNDEGR